MTLLSDTVFPEADSATTPTISRSPMRNEILSTARTRPRSVRNETERPRTSSRILVSLSGKAHPGIDGRVDQIDHGVGGDDEEGGIDHGRHDYRQIEGLQGVVRQLANALQAEDDLGQQRSAADQRAEIQAEQGDEGDQRGPQRMAQQYAGLAQTLRARGADVILLVGFHNACAQDASLDADIEDRKRYPRYHHDLEPAPRVLGQGFVAKRRHPGKHPCIVESRLGYEIDDLAQPVDRHGDADQS